jgi:hypothetical protein
MIKGFNLGQMHHFAQMEYRDNGFIPDDLIERIKTEVPAELLQVCRMSGTMSNQWALDLVGYNHRQHDNQIAGRRDVPQPTISYFYPFVDFYKQMGFKSLVWTVNSISPWSNPNERNTWERRMWMMLDEIDRQGIVLSCICLENEHWMYPQCMLMPNGNLPFAQKLLHSPANAFRNDAWWGNNIVKPFMRSWLDYLQGISRQLRIRYPNVPQAISVDNNTHLRGRWLMEVLREYRFYDIVCPHIYIRPSNTAQTRSMITERVRSAASLNKPVWVTEFNWDYGLNDAGVTWGSYHDNHFRNDAWKALEDAGAQAAFFHTLWSGRSSYGYVGM